MLPMEAMKARIVNKWFTFIDPTNRWSHTYLAHNLMCCREKRFWDKTQNPIPGQQLENRVFVLPSKNGFRFSMCFLEERKISFCIEIHGLYSFLCIPISPNEKPYISCALSPLRLHYFSLKSFSEYREVFWRLFWFISEDTLYLFSWNESQTLSESEDQNEFPKPLDILM